jgi:hypothetical protein
MVAFSDLLYDTFDVSESIRQLPSEVETEFLEAQQHLQQLLSDGAPANELLLAQIDAQAKKQAFENPNQSTMYAPPTTPTPNFIKKDTIQAADEQSVETEKTVRVTRSVLSITRTRAKEGNGLPSRLRLAVETAEVIAASEEREESNDYFGIPHVDTDSDLVRNFQDIVGKVMSGKISLDMLPVPRNKAERAKAKQAISELTDTPDDLKNQEWTAKFFRIQQKLLR